jgi:hypothetical protein
MTSTDWLNVAAFGICILFLGLGMMLERELMKPPRNPKTGRYAPKRRQ